MITKTLRKIGQKHFIEYSKYHVYVKKILLHTRIQTYYASNTLTVEKQRRCGQARNRCKDLEGGGTTIFFQQKHNYHNKILYYILNFKMFSQ